MLQTLKKEANSTYTENGALTHASTMSECLDLFATVGALRNADEADIVERFVRAYAEQPDMAMKILFYARDVREGLGERRVFRVLLKFLCEYHTESVLKNLSWIAEMGRYDDFLELLGTPCENAAIAFLRAQFEEDMEKLNRGRENISLLAKWLPSVNTSNPSVNAMGRKLSRAFGLTERKYRKCLSALRAKIRIIENQLRERDYTFDYEKQPSKAMLKYRAAFFRNDKERYQEYLHQVACGTAQMHTGTLAPYDIIRPFYDKLVSEEETHALEVIWNNLENFAGEENALVVIDGSGSMYGGRRSVRPIQVAHSLGLYFAERNKGAFANHFITFSHTPRLVEIKGNTLKDKIEYMKTFDEIADTNLQAVFELILHTAVKHGVPQSEMPQKIYIISDMEFNYCVQGGAITNFEYAKKLFEAAGYSLPTVVFWNVESRNRQQPVTKNEQGAVLVSGCTPRLFAQVMSDHTNPYDFMLETLQTERYEKIVA